MKCANAKTYYANIYSGNGVVKILDQYQVLTTGTSLQNSYYAVKYCSYPQRSKSSQRYWPVSLNFLGNDAHDMENFLLKILSVLLVSIGYVLKHNILPCSHTMGKMFISFNQTNLMENIRYLSG